MKHNVLTEWKENMHFDSVVNGHHIPIDLAKEAGGENKGARPKQLLLAALSGCTGLDVVSILKKMRVEISSLRIKVEANVTDTTPSYYDHIHVIYEFTGKDLPHEKLKRAVHLSQEQYCGVSFMLKKAMPVTYEIRTSES